MGPSKAHSVKFGEIQQSRLVDVIDEGLKGSHKYSGILLSLSSHLANGSGELKIVDY